MRNVPLAHALHDVDVGHEIPEDLYEAVAEVLEFHLRTRGDGERATSSSLAEVAI